MYIIFPTIVRAATIVKNYIMSVIKYTIKIRFAFLVVRSPYTSTPFFFLPPFPAVLLVGVPPEAAALFGEEDEPSIFFHLCSYIKHV